MLKLSSLWVITHKEDNFNCYRICVTMIVVLMQYDMHYVRTEQMRREKMMLHVTIVIALRL